jgi:hypothetical protein
MSQIISGLTIRAFAVTAGSIAVFSAGVAAQAGSASERAVAVLKEGETVWVTMPAGTVQGRFRSWSGSIFEWEATTGLIRMPLRDIERIEASDPVRDGVRRGALLGAGAGTGFGLLLGIGLSCTRDCGAGYSRTRDISGASFAFAVLGAGGGAGAGAGLDALIHRRRLVYRRPATARVTVTPIIGPGRRAAAVLFRW